MTSENNPLGNIYISHRAIATVAYHVALSSYGVVGLAAKNFGETLASVLVKDPMLGVDIDYVDKQLEINLYIIVEYGTRIITVADQVVDAVRYQLEKTLGIPVKTINVHVRGLRISNTD